MNYEAAIEYIVNTAKFGSNLGLSRTKKILELLGNPQDKIKCIHIAGTNGKGSTTAMINSILCEGGYKVGMYISPYLEDFEERIQINNNNIPKEDLARIITSISKVVDEVVSMGYDHPTEFEIITCAMFLYFYEEKVDYAVVEVGLGGRLDSTNVIHPLISVITSISFDHVNILGSTLEEIAFEKAGIIKPHTPVVVYPQKEEALAVIEKKAEENHCKLIKVKEEQVSLREIISSKNRVYQSISLDTEREHYDINLSLLGKHQLINCAVAINAIEELMTIEGITIEKERILSALSKVKWPGRLEVVNFNPRVVLDGAHNFDGIQKLSQNIKEYFNYENLVLIIGILADKQVEEMLLEIVPLANKIITVTPHSDRASSGEELKAMIEKINPNCEVEEDYEKAYKKALAYCSAEDLIVICGSLYMIGDMRRTIRLANC